MDEDADSLIDPCFEADNDGDDEEDDDDDFFDDDGMVNLVDVPVGAGKSCHDDDPFEYEDCHRIYYPPSRQTLTLPALSRHMADITNDVAQIIPAPPTCLRLLLTEFRWDKDALIEYFVEHDRTATFSRAGLTDPVVTTVCPIQRLSDSVTVSSSTSKAPQTEVLCEICFSITPPDQMYSLVCGHYFCLTCWRHYLDCKIVNESQTARIHCPSSECWQLVEDESVLQLLQDPLLRRRFQRLVCNSFVLSNRSLTWCPGADCGQATRCPGTKQARRVVCSNCSESFCFACGQPWHDPVRCQQLRTWLRKVTEDSGTSNWISANTKECPKCHIAIEKNGGCNHMVCRNVACKHEFCWLCLDRWEPHGSRWYNCNRFNEESSKSVRDAQAAARVSLERFLFYLNRYLNHSLSLRCEARLYESVQNKMEAMLSNHTSWIDVQFFKNVVDVLCNCRRTLMYTYAFAFFLKSNNHSLIFEGNQSDLEHATEQLSEFLEGDSLGSDLTELKQKVQDKAHYCESRRKVLLDHVHEGYKKDFWEVVDR